LLPLLPVGKIVIENFLEKVQLEYTSLKESFTGAIVLDKKDTSLAPSGDKAAPKLPKKDTLANIIEKVNERFGGDFTETDRVIIESIFQMFMNDKEMKKYKRYAKDSSPEMFVQSLFPDKFKEIATQCCMDNADSYKKLFTDTEFYQKVMEAMAKELYKALRKD
jgi:type I restriction enzyme R subunit